MYFVKYGAAIVGCFEDEKDIADWVRQGGAQSYRSNGSVQLIAYKTEDEGLKIETKVEFIPVAKKASRKVKIVGDAPVKDGKTVLG